MNKKDISEIKKTLTVGNTSITRIRTCYVDGEKKVVLTSNNAFLSMREEEQFKYADILKKVFSGRLTKNLFELNFTLDQELEGSQHKLLLALKDTELGDEAFEALCNNIIESYYQPENYLITLALGKYDVPSKSSDGLDLEDGSEVYTYVICAVSRVILPREGLCYDETSNSFIDTIGSRAVQAPDVGFLFPAFNDRSSDIHQALYYSKSAGDLSETFLESAVGATLPETFEQQKDVFVQTVEEVLGDNCNFDTVLEVVDHLVHESAEQKNASDETPALDKHDLKLLLNADDKDLADITDAPLAIENITDIKKVTIQDDNFTVQVKSEATDLIETRIIDGIEYMLVPVSSGLTINGITVKGKQKINVHVNEEGRMEIEE